METLLALNSRLNSLVWGPPMLGALIGLGAYLSIRTGFVQFARFGLMSRETMGKIFRRGPGAEGDISPFQAVTVAMGGTVGVGNIAGVATAIALGGPGAFFWMFVSGLLGMCTKFCEVVLSMILTAYDTNLAWCFYGETCAAYLLGHGRAVRYAYRFLWLPFTLLGALGRLEAVWDVADTLNGLMAIPNIVALLVLAGVVVRLLRGFLAGEPYAPPE
jgi:Na+/alanine symporter